MKRFNIIITLSATLGLFSCELDKMPMDQVSDAVFWQKPADFELAANDFYFGLQEVSQYIDMNSDIAFGSGTNDVSDGSYLAPVNSDDGTTHGNLSNLPLICLRKRRNPVCRTKRSDVGKQKRISSVPTTIGNW